MRVMLDTNILVSMIFFPSDQTNRFAKELGENHRIVLCDYVIDELQLVMERKFQKLSKAMDEFFQGLPYDLIYTPNDFYKDHCKTYQKRPIYWLFDSGKKNGFKCLVYMHRYQPDTIARIRTDYVHEQQARYRTSIEDLETRIANAETSERVKLSKQLTKVQEQAKELHDYEEKIHHLADQMISIDLDDGLKHNYEIFKDVLAKIK